MKLASSKNWLDSDLYWLFPPTYLIKATNNHLRICKVSGILIVPEWQSSYFSPVLHPNGIPATFIIDFNSYYTSSAENSIFKDFANFETIAFFIYSFFA